MCSANPESIVYTVSQYTNRPTDSQHLTPQECFRFTLYAMFAAEVVVFCWWYDVDELMFVQC
jgi:hypothetical protein